MSYVVMQAAELPSDESARRVEAELQSLFDAYAHFEKTDPTPWSKARIAPPLVDFGARHGIAWPADEKSRFLLKGPFIDTAGLLRVDRLVFFWAGGFDLGGATLKRVLESMGAVRTANSCHLVVANDDPSGRVAELASFLEDEDHGGQFSVDDGAGEKGIHDLTVVGEGGTKKRIVFHDTSAASWALVALLPQLDGEDPSLV